MGEVIVITILVVNLLIFFYALRKEKSFRETLRFDFGTTILEIVLNAASRIIRFISGK